MYLAKFHWIPAIPLVEHAAESIAEITAFVHMLHTDYDLRGSNWNVDQSILYKDGKRVGNISYNGRVWGDLRDLIDITDKNQNARSQ